MSFFVDLLKILLIVLSIYSFYPQLSRLRQIKSTNGISIVYLLCNLIVATEQFALGLHLVTIDAPSRPRGIAHRPPNIGDWLNLAQFGVVWACQLVLFCHILYLPPSRRLGKTSAILAYLIFLTISLGFYAFEASLPPTDRSDMGDYRNWISVFFEGGHMFYINPVVTVLGVLAAVPQLFTTHSGSSVGALSVKGLWIQALVFAIVGISWPFRLIVSKEFDLDRMTPLKAILTWWQVAGWAPADNIVFACVQGILFFAIGQRAGGESEVGERTALLH